MKPRSWVIGLFLLVLLVAGGALRLINIGTPSIWVDENITVAAAKGVVETGRPVMRVGYIYGRGLLYTYSVATVYRFFGISLENARRVSALFGLISILISYLLAARLFGWKAGLFTAFFVTFSFYEIGWSRVARMYSLLQMMNLLSVLCFFMHFKFSENSGAMRAHSDLRDESSPPWSWRLLWLLAGLLLCVITTLWVHNINVITLLGYGLILVILVAKQIASQGFSKKLDPYRVMILGMFLFGVVAILADTEFSKLIKNFYTYMPAWAKQGSSASQKWVLFPFLFSWNRFPLGLLFLWGGFEMIRRREKYGWMLILLTLLPLIIFTFVFTHRHPKYFFSALPLVFIGAAYGLLRVYEQLSRLLFQKIRFSQKTARLMTIALIGLCFVISPWLRIAKNIPFLEDGKTNGAVYFNEWREAASVLRLEAMQGDLIISSLPEALGFYGIEADWALNNSNLELSMYREARNQAGQLIEIYAGKPLILSASQFIDLISTHSRGWIVLTDYHFNQSIYTPDAIRDIIQSRLNPPRFTRNRTIRIYHWDHLLESANAF
jgi:4-amino-4-deoxy-L-arabinose transferase-like glycosyltransferase